MDNTKEEKMTLEVYYPAMCCSTGVCGPDVDDELVDFTNEVKWLKSQGIDIQRYNLGQEPEAFKSNPEVIKRLQNEGSDILPIVTVNGSIVLEGKYPSREKVVDWFGISLSEETNSSTEKQQVLRSLKKSVMQGYLDQMRNYFRLGEEIGISKQELMNTIQDAINKRQQTTRMAVDAANELLGVSSNGCAPGSGCC